MANELPNPITRDEKYLAKAAGVEVDIPTPITREEHYLNAIAEGGGGSGFTPTQAQLDAMNSGITSADVEQITTNKTNILLKQDIIDSSHKLNADLVDDSSATNKFATAAQLSQIATNTSNIAQKIGASDYATQNTGGTVRAWTTTDGTSTTLHIATEAPSP